MPSGAKGLTFAELRLKNASRCRRWHQGGIEEWSASDWAVATMGEAGEMCGALLDAVAVLARIGEAANALKKLRRVETGALNLNELGRELTEVDAAINKIGEELADTMIYLDLLAQRLDINLAAEVVSKFNLVSERYGFPERLGSPTVEHLLNLARRGREAVSLWMAAQTETDDDALLAVVEQQIFNALQRSI